MARATQFSNPNRFPRRPSIQQFAGANTPKRLWHQFGSKFEADHSFASAFRVAPHTRPAPSSHRWRNWEVKATFDWPQRRVRRFGQLPDQALGIAERSPPAPQVHHGKVRSGFPVDSRIANQLLGSSASHPSVEIRTASDCSGLQIGQPSAPTYCTSSLTHSPNIAAKSQGRHRGSPNPTCLLETQYLDARTIYFEGLWQPAAHFSF